MKCRIKEADFVAVENRRKSYLSELIKKSSLPYTQIADETGVERRAVKRALDGEGIRFDTFVRLEYFLQLYLRETEKANKSI